MRRVLLRDPEQETSPLLKPRGGREGRYQVVGEIARGGVGVVLKGRDVDLGRDVAMKVLRDEHRDNREILQRFVEEAQIGGQLQHPGIVPVYEMAISDQQRPYFTMKLVKGKTLAALLRARRDPTEGLRRFLAIFERVCDTMAYAHSRDVIHRDLKPANIIIGAYSEVQIVDWGFAKVLGREEPEHVERTVVETVRSGSESMAGSVMGTPAYMPPEQALGQVESLDKSSDVFGLGAILCEILTGSPPYTGKDGSELMMKAARRDFDESRLDGFDLGPLAKRCLSAKQSERPQDAGELAAAVQDHLAAAEERTRAAQVAAAEEQAHAEEARHARRLTVAIGAAVLLAIGLGAAFWIHAEREERKRMTDIAAQVRPLIDEANLLRGRGELDAALVKARSVRDIAGGDDEAGTRLIAEIEQEIRDRELKKAIADSYELDMAREKCAAIDRALAEFHGVATGSVTDKLRTRPPELQVRVAHALDDVAGRMIWNRNRPRAEWVARLDAAQTLDPDPWRTRMRDALKSGDPRRVCAVASDAPLDESRTVAWAAWFLDLHGAGADAVQKLRKAWLRSPDSFDVNEALARVLWRSSEDDAGREGALAHYRACHALRPDSARLQGDLASALWQLRRYGEALAHAQRVTQLRPSRAAGFFLVGTCQYELGDPKAGRNSFDKAEQLAQDAGDWDVLNNLAWLMVFDPAAPCHDPQRGLRLVRLALEIVPTDYATLNTLAMALYRTGDFEGAVEAVGSSLGARPEQSSEGILDHYVLALAYWRMGEHDKARAAYRSARSADRVGDPAELEQLEKEAKALGIDK